MSPALREFGVGLRELVLSKFPTLQAFAAAMDVHPTTVSRWVSGRIAPDAESLAKMAALLEVEPGRLTGVAADRRDRDKLDGRVADAAQRPLIRIELSDGKRIAVYPDGSVRFA